MMPRPVYPGEGINTERIRVGDGSVGHMGRHYSMGHMGHGSVGADP